MSAPIAIHGEITTAPVPGHSNGRPTLTFEVLATHVQRDGGQWLRRDQPFNCSIFGPSAETFAATLRMGVAVTIEGRSRRRVGSVERVAVVTVVLHEEPAPGTEINRP